MARRLKVSLENIRWWLLRQISYNQFLPSKEDLECKEAKELSKKLIGDSFKGTLTNIVEWQERNIQYWHERAEMFILLFILSAFAFFFVPLPQHLWMIPLIIIIFWLFFGDFMTFLIGILLLISEVLAAILVFVYVATSDYLSDCHDCGAFNYLWEYFISFTLWDAKI